MKPPPDEKAVEELATAERGKTARGKWRVVVLLLLILVLLAGGALVILETNRQADIHAARGELEHEEARVAARYKDVSDWHQWYVDSLPEGCEYEAFGQWIDACGNSGLIDAKVFGWASEFSTDLSEHYGSGGAAPTRADQIAWLDDSQHLADAARDMLRHPHIALVPSISEGVPVFKVLPTILAVQLLVYRATVLQVLGEWDRAWAEIVDVLRLVQRWDRPCALLDMTIAASYERLIHGRIEAMMVARPPGDALLHSLRIQPPQRAGLERELVNYELAYFAQIFGALTPEQREDWTLFDDTDDAALFTYLAPGLSWEERRHAFNGEADITRATAAYLRKLSNILNDPSGPVGDFDRANPLFGGFEQLSGNLAEVLLLRQGTAVLCEVQLAQSGNALHATLTRLAKEYPDYEVVADESTIIVRVRPSEELWKRLTHHLVPSEEELHERYQPVRLSRKK